MALSRFPTVDTMSDAHPTEDPPLPQRASLDVFRPDTVLRFCETVHFTGTLSFATDTGKGLLPVLNGAPEVSGDAAMEAALDEFLGLTAGTYTLHQILPNLENATRDGDLMLHGKLTEGVIPELMRYCESAGISGTLHLNHAENRCDARYVRGELASITIDREEDADLSRVFAWPDGSFVIESRPVFEDGPRVTAPEPFLLKTLEIALAEIMDQRQRRSEVPPSPFRAPSIRSLKGVAFGVEHAPGVLLPPRPATVQPPPRRTVSPPAPQSADSTVKVFFVARKSLEASPTQHSSAHLGREELKLDSSRQLQPLTEETAAQHIAASKSQPPSARITTPPPPAPSAPSAPPGNQMQFSAWSAAFGAMATLTTGAAIWMLYNLLH